MALTWNVQFLTKDHQNQWNMHVDVASGNVLRERDDIIHCSFGESPKVESSKTSHAHLTPTKTLEAAVANRDAAITNLFYWNNVLHDVLWKYGFDEPSGNFQNDNQGRGGAGGDFVQADAQDGSGVNNANFSTPIDGGNGRMQMYLGDLSSGYQPDSDFDNGLIAHEYGHGWSLRLAGGPATTGCLENVEEAGEGWSDYITLMTTTDWTSLTPTVASANIPRGIVTYYVGEPTTGNGIRPFRYSYDMANINPTVTYAAVGNSAVFSQPHGIGSIWATMLWDMTWEIIFQDNYIASNIYDVPVNIADYKGNIAALKLVNEGLRLNLVLQVLSKPVMPFYKPMLCFLEGDTAVLCQKHLPVED